jgi:hypothetical protein
MGALKLFHRVHRGVVPFSSRRIRVGPVFCQRLLNLRNSLRGRSHLPLVFLARTDFFCGSVPTLARALRRSCLGGGRLRLGCRRLRDANASKHTRACRHQQRQAQVHRSSQNHPASVSNQLRTPCHPVRPVSYCLLSAGTTPGRNTVNVRSLSPRRRTLNTTFSPGFRAATAFL